MEFSAPCHFTGCQWGIDNIQHLRHVSCRLLSQQYVWVIATFFLILFVLAITDSKNLAVQGNVGPFMIGLAVFAIGNSFGVGSGYAINPARDFGPRLFTWLAGWGPNAFPGPFGYWWVPILGPLVGAVIAVLVYKYGIELTLDRKKQAVETEGSEESARRAAQ